jgi:hypothetical protein
MKSQKSKIKNQKSKVLAKVGTSEGAQQAHSSRQAGEPTIASNAARAERTRVKVMATIMDKVEQSLGEAAADPSSEAGQLVRSLVLTEMVSADARLQDAKRLYEETRRRQEAENKVRNVQEIAAKAQQAGGEQKPFNYDRALKQISAVIGVGQPLAEYDAPDSPAL